MTERPLNILYLGVGNRMRRDDGAGPYIVEQLRCYHQDAAELTVQNRTLHFQEHSGEGASLMALWKRYDEVYLFDAAMKQGQPAKETTINAIKEGVPSDFFRYSSHAFSVAEAVELARCLDALPSVMIITAIEGGDFSQGTGLSEPVFEVCNTIVRRFRHYNHTVTALTESF